MKELLADIAQDGTPELVSSVFWSQWSVAKKNIHSFVPSFIYFVFSGGKLKFDPSILKNTAQGRFLLCRSAEKKKIVELKNVRDAYLELGYLSKKSARYQQISVFVQIRQTFLTPSVWMQVYPFSQLSRLRSQVRNAR